MHDERDRLIAELALPHGWSPPASVVDNVRIGHLKVARAGVAARNADGLEVTGSAAGLDVSPVHRAWAELLERVAIVDANEPMAGGGGPQRSARSNGVAAAPSWRDACARAALELAERDRVLRSWRGELAPEPAEVPAWLAALRTHRWRAVLLRGPDWLPDASVAVIVGFPCDRRLPLTRGFAARATTEAALESAAREALQCLAFLWGEPIPSDPPAPSPTPMFHLDYYLYPGHHDVLDAWLDGAHLDHASVVQREPRHARLEFVDLTPQHLRDRMRVARAVHEAAVPLRFGVASERIPEPLRVHPIP